MEPATISPYPHRIALPPLGRVTDEQVREALQRFLDVQAHQRQQLDELEQRRVQGEFNSTPAHEVEAMRAEILQAVPTAWGQLRAIVLDRQAEWQASTARQRNKLANQVVKQAEQLTGLIDELIQSADVLRMLDTPGRLTMDQAPASFELREAARALETAVEALRAATQPAG